MDINDFLAPMSVEFIPSYIDQKIEDQGLYFHCHIPKCAGSDFDIGLRKSILCSGKKEMGKSATFTGSGRLDSEEEYAQFHLHNRIKGDFLGLYSSHFGLVASRKLNFPAHTRFVTFLRSPIDRILSHYNYNCMRSASKPELNEFKSFIKLRENRNAMCHSIDRKARLDQLIRTIENKFFICADVQYISSCLSSILTRHGRPNVIKGRVNRTMDRYRLQRDALSDRLVQEFENYNAKDMTLYKHFYDNPILAVPTVGKDVAEVTTVCLGKQSEARFESQNYLVHTMGFLNYLCQLDSIPVDITSAIKGYTQEQQRMAS